MSGPAILVTGGAGFIGSAVCRHLVRGGVRVVNLDKLTYAGNLASLAEIEDAPNYRFVEADINDRETVARLLRDEAIGAIMHLAAESHVDRSIDGPGAFVETNVTGTYNLLEAARSYWQGRGQPTSFRFHHVSTDEVYGSLGPEGLFTEEGLRVGALDGAILDPMLRKKLLRTLAARSARAAARSATSNTRSRVSLRRPMRRNGARISDGTGCRSVAPTARLTPRSR